MGGNKAWQGAVDGMSNAANRAHHENPGWIDSAYEFLCDFAKQTDGGFMVCDVVEAAKSPELGCDDPRAWGQIVRMAKRNGIIENIGFSYTRKGKAHSSPKAVWRSAKK